MRKRFQSQKGGRTMSDQKSRSRRLGPGRYCVSFPVDVTQAKLTGCGGGGGGGGGGGAHTSNTSPGAGGGGGGAGAVRSIDYVVQVWPGSKLLVVVGEGGRGGEGGNGFTSASSGTAG